MVEIANWVLVWTREEERKATQEFYMVWPIKLTSIEDFLELFFIYLFIFSFHLQGEG
jgi:hypothetical protein